MNSDGPLRHSAHDDALVTIRQASKEDAATVSAITDAAYSKYIHKLGQKPEPMTADYVETISKRARLR